MEYVKCAHLIWEISMKNVKFQRFQQGFADSSCMENSLKDMHAIKGSLELSWGEQGRQWGMWPLLGPAGACSWTLRAPDH